jgi:tetratricopeptide (TPR) repeat protein
MPWILTEIGRLSIHVHRTEIAEECVRLAKATGTDNTFIAVLEGRIHLRKQQSDQAVASFRRGVTMSQYDAWPHFHLGRLLIERGELQTAIDVLHAGEELEAKKWRPRRSLIVAIRTQLALAYLYNEDHAEADRWLNLVVDEDAGNPEVLRALAYLEAARGQTGVAERLLERLQVSNVRDRYKRAQIHLFRAMVHFGLGQKERASEEFSQASQSDPRNLFILFRWADTLVDLAREASSAGEADAANLFALRAKEIASRVLKYDRDNARALRLLERIADEFNVM